MHLNKDLREFIELLNSKAVDYVVVGAFAVAWHGYPRFTADIDFLVRPTSDNGAAVVAVLEAFGFRSLKLTAEDFSKPDQIVQLGMKPNRIDLITSISGVDFEQAWANRVAGSIDGIPVSFLGIDDLILNKETSARKNDLGDADALRRRRPGL
jgi:hypothetical protein